ncbi:MAG TPA: ATP-binding protein [Lentimicrobium sp.]|nr:ATP-binding protein [Lentimicrobium sp.]
MGNISGQIDQSWDLLNEIFKQAEINTNVGTFSWNLETLELWYSDNFYRLLGCEPGEFKPDIDYFNNNFIHPEDRVRIEKIRKNTIERKEAGTWEYRIIAKTGEIKHVKAISNTIEVSGTKILVGSLQDITREVSKLHQLEKRQEELRIANLELKTSLKIIEHAELSAGLGHWLINLDTNEFTFSENLQKMTAYPLNEEFNFERVLNLIHPDDRQNLIETSLKDYQMNRTSVSVFRLLRQDGNIRYIKGTSDRMKINKVNLIVGIAQDITSLIDKEIMLEEKNILLERQNEELASFNHMASHDLQEPIRKIMVLSKMILDKEEQKLSKDSLNYFNRMLHAANRMQSLINDLLDYSRANNPNSIKVKSDLNKILKESLHNLKEDIAIKEAVVNAARLPVLTVIPSQIQQLFINLLDNSLKYCKDHAAPVINITSKTVPGDLITGFGLKKIAYYHCITFSDNGIGFEPKYANKIFEIFQRLHGKNEYSGTGIGLTICKKIIQNHNGYITATGTPGEGAIFNIFLPYENS